MEATIMLTSLTLGSFFLFPVIVDFVKNNWGVLGALILGLVVLHALTPYSPEADAAWKSIARFPSVFTSGFAYADGGLADLTASYHRAFRS
ncbi:MAG: hypothetical protein AB7P76_00715 [Candidatus Melainabacteria bacterium]